jgi:hypothetical protein
MTRSRGAARTTGRQEEQQQLLKEAERRPGVAELLAAYGALARYGGTVRSELPVIRYATGGNYSTRAG